MKRHKIINRNISLIFDFLRYITEHSDTVGQIPDGCELRFIDRGFSSPEEDKGKKAAKRAVLKVGYVFNISS